MVGGERCSDQLDSFDWADVGFSKCFKEEVADAARLRSQLDGKVLSMSSSFSGTLAAETAARQAVHASNKRLGLQTDLRVVSLGAIEKNRQMLEEMLWLEESEKPGCIF